MQMHVLPAFCSEMKTVWSLVNNPVLVIPKPPPPLPLPIAELWLRGPRQQLAGSYVTPRLKALDADARSAGPLFLNECGLDPGLDHMSAMEMIDRIHGEGGSVVSFESFTGGLIAHDADPGNPWRYKFTWNPRNVVLAGQQGDEEYLRHDNVL